MTMVADPSWACAQTVSRFFQHLDEGEEAAGAALFTEDGVWQRRGEPVRGRAAILRALLERPATRISRHLVTNLVVDAEAEARRVRYYVTIYAHDAPFEGVPPLAGPVMILVCDDRLVEQADGWRFAQRSSRTVFLKPAS